MGKTVLIVEDQFLIAIGIEDTVTSLGYEVAGIAASRNQALGYLEEVDVALVDVNLTDGATGPEIGRLLANHGSSVVFMTANPEAVAGGVEGTLGVLTKPVDESVLSKVLRFVTDKREGQNPCCPDALKLFAH